MKLFAVLLLIVVAWGALAFGAVYSWAYWPLAALCAGLGLWGLAGSNPWADRPLRPLLVGLTATAVAIGLQLVPLPYAVFSRIDPGADRFLSNYEVAYQLQAPAWHALSIDSTRTLTALGLFVALGLFLIGAARVISRIALDRLVTRLIVLGVGLAVFGVVQKAANAGTPTRLVYGFWKPIHAGDIFGPFINRNHFAGWMVLVLPLAIGYSCAVFLSSQRPSGSDWGRWVRWLTTPAASRVAVVAVSILTMGTALALSGSRSGIASFAVALGAFALMAVRRADQRTGRRVAMLYVGALLVGAVAWAGVGSTIGRFRLSGQDLPDRFAAWRDTLHITKDFPIAGTGLGTYGIAMLLYQTADRSTMFLQAHNDYLQLAAEGGLLVAVPAAFTIAALVRLVRRRLTDGDDDLTRSWIRVGAVASLIGIATQSFVEFSLQMPGITALCVLIGAIAIQRGERPSRGRPREASSRARSGSK